MKCNNICVIGMGYVGLTLSVVLAQKGFVVYGAEKNPEVLAQLNQGKAHFYERGLDILIKKHINKNLFFSESVPADKKVDTFVITVGTPIDKKTKKTKMDHIQGAVDDVASNLQDEQLVILRSTVAIGTTREVVLPALEKTGKEFYLAFCPERTTEGTALKELKELPQIIGGIDEESVEKAMDLFRKITPTTVEVASLEDAEMNKMLDNAYRDLTFACANEIALIAKKLGLDGFNLIKAGNLGYPRTNIPVPGFVGGACLEKDPWILVDCVLKRTGYLPKLIKTAREINEYLPVYVVERIEEDLNKKGITKKDAKIFVSGFAFKGRPATDDLRGSPTVDLFNILKENGFENVYGHDFVVTPRAIQDLGAKATEIEYGFSDADAVIFMNNHRSYEDLNIESLLMTMKKGGLFFDGWHLYNPEDVAQLGHVSYEGISV